MVIYNKEIPKCCGECSLSGTGACKLWMTEKMSKELGIRRHPDCPFKLTLQSGPVIIDTKNITETIAIWLSDLFKNEMEEAMSAADNERTFAIGSDDEESKGQHISNMDENLRYAQILKEAYNSVQEYWGKYGNYINNDEP